MQVSTVKIKADNPKGYRIINASDFDPKQHQVVEGEAPAEKSAAEVAATEELEAKRKAEANRGQTEGSGGVVTDRNPSGTFSEPTPTDIRYPNKDETEFENNYGAHIGKSAAGLREELGMEDKPGGLNPAKKEAEDKKEADARLEAKRLRDGETALPEAAEDDGLNGMSARELREYAAENEIDLGDARSKADMIAVIQAANA